MNLPFLRIPPFPGSRPASALQGQSVQEGQCVPPNQCVRPAPPPSGGDRASLVALLRDARVGGRFWGAQPGIEPGTIILVPADAAQLRDMIAQLPPAAAALICAPRKLATPRHMPTVAEADPWWLARHAAQMWVGAACEEALVAAISGCELRLFGTGPFRECDSREGCEAVVARLLAQNWRDPFDGGPIDIKQAIALLAEWRRLIDANRGNAAIYGVARWKRTTLDALLWSGGGRPPYARTFRPGRPGIAPDQKIVAQKIVAWKSRSPRTTLAAIEAAGHRVAELEDGFIRSSGLGANCVPPLSVILDASGVYFDPTGPSDLERLLEQENFNPSLIQRASALRQRLVEFSISKYGQGCASIAPRHDGRRRVLVTGQVEDDRSMLSGGAGCSNSSLLAQARKREPDAWIIYKPHPDVEAGHRKGHIPDGEVLRHADEIERHAPIASLIESVDAVHCITSLAGFEALLRGKQVIVHGMPFYAGWGLTTDLATVPERRTRQRTLDELVAATLLLYPRYLDPVTRLPCPAEVVVDRLATGRAQITSPLVALREWQGRTRAFGRRLASLVRTGRQP